MSDRIVLASELGGDTAAIDMALCEKVSRKLNETYSGHPWLVGADHSAGTVHVQLAYFDPLRQRARYGFVLHISRLNSDPGMKSVVMAGGECLERQRIARGSYRDGGADIAMSNGVDLTGRVDR